MLMHHVPCCSADASALVKAFQAAVARSRSMALCTPDAPCVLQVIVGSESHILNYEGGGASAYGGIIYRTGVDDLAAWNWTSLLGMVSMRWAMPETLLLRHLSCRQHSVSYACLIGALSRLAVAYELCHAFSG